MKTNEIHKIVNYIEKAYQVLVLAYTLILEWN